MDKPDSLNWAKSDSRYVADVTRSRLPPAFAPEVAAPEEVATADWIPDDALPLIVIAPEDAAEMLTEGEAR